MTCLETGDGGSTVFDEFLVNSAWCSCVFLFSSISFFQEDHNPHEIVSGGSHCIFEFHASFPYSLTKIINNFHKLVNEKIILNSILNTKLLK